MDIAQFLPVLVSALISAAGTGIGVYVSMARKIAVLETKIDILMAHLEGVDQLGARVGNLEWRVTVLEDAAKRKG